MGERASQTVPPQGEVWAQLQELIFRVQNIEDWVLARIGHDLRVCEATDCCTTTHEKTHGRATSAVGMADDEEG